MSDLKCTLRKVRLNAGGYDNMGSYWGTGNPLYFAADESKPDLPSFYLRARNREHAKQVVVARWPHATFYR